jgi:hypothetical protein
MRVAYLTQIADEEKLIYNHLCYYYNIGVRDFFITFNNSNEETKNEVVRFINTHSNANVKTEIDNEIRYNQSEIFTSRCNEIYKSGVKWILPVDADEIIKIPDGLTIQDCFTHHDNNAYGYINCRWFDYHPVDDSPIDNYFTDWTHRQVESRKESKVIVKWSPGMKMGIGHHLITAKRNKIADAKKIFFAHFPNRDYEQVLKKKIKIGKAFIENYGINDGHNQIKQYKEYLNDPEYFRKSWDKLQETRKSMNLVYDPIDKKLFE